MGVLQGTILGPVVKRKCNNKGMFAGLAVAVRRDVALLERHGAVRAGAARAAQATAQL